MQIAANDNMRVAYCTTSAQYFHLLRRQAALLWDAPRPLVVMTPKGLLKVDKPPVGSSLSDLTDGVFHPVLDDPRPRDRAAQVTRLVLCSGKVYVDMVGREDYAQADHIAVARIEELYPFPFDDVQEVIAGYPNLRQVVWLQEEPRNMGPWVFVSSRIRELLPPGVEFSYVGRPKAASPVGRVRAASHRGTKPPTGSGVKRGPGSVSQWRKIKKERCRPCPLKFVSRRWENPSPKPPFCAG